MKNIQILWNISDSFEILFYSFDIPKLFSNIVCFFWLFLIRHSSINQVIISGCFGKVRQVPSLVSERSVLGGSDIMSKMKTVDSGHDSFLKIIGIFSRKNKKGPFFFQLFFYVKNMCMQIQRIFKIKEYYNYVKHKSWQYKI